MKNLPRAIVIVGPALAVGAGLLANALVQRCIRRRIQRLRQQAGSYRFAGARRSAV